jgi:hypothetical protein
MNYKENNLKMIYHGIYKFDLYSLKFYKNKLFIKPIIEKEGVKDGVQEVVKVVKEVQEGVQEKVQEVQEVQVVTDDEIIELYSNNKIIFTGLNNIDNQNTLKNIYNIDFNEYKNKKKYILFFNQLIYVNYK